MKFYYRISLSLIFFMGILPPLVYAQEEHNPNDELLKLLEGENCGPESFAFNEHISRYNFVRKFLR